MIWYLSELVKSAQTTHVELNGKWVAARPINHKYCSWKERFQAAWLVLKGEADVVIWPEGQ